MTRALILAALLVCIPTSGVSTGGASSATPSPVLPVWSDSFVSDRWSDAWKVTKDDWGADLRQRMTESSAVGPVSFLRVSYPAGSSSPASHTNYGTPLGGTQWYAKPLQPTDAWHLRYYVRFAPGFGFNKGGKLPGLFGGRCCSGGCQPDGTNGFSTRFMWRTNGAGEVYAYLDTPSTTGYGTSLGRGSWTFTPGKWYCIEQECRLNTPGASDGSVTVWLDGQRVFQATGLKFRTVPTLQIEGILFSTFFGGDDASWGAPDSTTIDFSSFAIGTGYIGR